MHSRSLKVNIVTTLVVILAVAMILLQLVVNFIDKNKVVLQEIEKIESLALVAGAFASKLYGYETPELKSQDAGLLNRFIAYAGNPPLIIVNTSGKKIYETNMSKDLKNQLTKISQTALTKNKTVKYNIGKTWGIFSEEWQYLVISFPLFQNHERVGRLSAAISYDGIYLKLHDRHTVLFFYIIINTLIFALVGFHRINKITIKPIRKLVEQAETYKDDSQHFGFLYDKEKNEFGKLSKALNRMLNQISEDKIALKKSVKTLEKLNIDLKNAQNEIIRAEKLSSVGRLSAGIAHEIGNPISIVLGYLELLKTLSPNSNERSDYILRAEKEINRIDSIIKQLLNFARPGEENHDIISLHDLINETVVILRDQPIMSQTELTLDLTADCDLVKADADRLRQVFLNLILNAADAIGLSAKSTGGRIQIKSQNVVNPQNSHQKLIKMQFIDNGIGIPADCLDNIFDPFFTTKEPGKGTGLGLSVCYMIVEQMGGTIFAESNRRQGSQISMLLPVCDPLEDSDA